jgi:hypothetical protein
MVGNMVSVMFDEVSHQPVQLYRREAASLRGETALDHLSRSAADHVAGGGVSDAWQTDTRKNDVERVNQIRCAVDQCAVEIENDEGREHDPRSLPVGKSAGKKSNGKVARACPTPVLVSIQARDYAPRHERANASDARDHATRTLESRRGEASAALTRDVVKLAQTA